MVACDGLAGASPEVQSHVLGASKQFGGDGGAPETADGLREPSDTSRTTWQQPGVEPDCRGGEVDSR